MNEYITLLQTLDYKNHSIQKIFIDGESLLHYYNPENTNIYKSIPHKFFMSNIFVIATTRKPEQQNMDHRMYLSIERRNVFASKPWMRWRIIEWSDLRCRRIGNLLTDCFTCPS